MTPVPNEGSGPASRQPAEETPLRQPGVPQELPSAAVQRLQGQLQDCEARLAELQRVAHIGYWNLDLGTDELVWSDEIYRIFGIQCGEFPGTNDAFLKFVPADERTAILRASEAAIRDHQPYAIDHQIVRTDGTIRVVHERGEVSYDAGGRPVRLFGTVQDVTEQTKAEQALRESEERYRRLFEDAGLGIFQSTPDGQIISANPAFAQMFGYASPEDVVAGVKDVATDLFVDPQRREVLLRRTISGEKRRQYENLYRRKDGSLFVGSLTVQAVRQAGGGLLRLEGFIEDITERKAAEDALRRSEERFRSLFEEAQDAIFICRDDDAILDANPAACELMGYSREELLGTRVPELIAPERRRPAGSTVQSELASGGQFEGLNLHRDGHRIPVEVRVSRLGEPGLGLALSVVRDITERKAAEQLLRQSEERYRTLVENSADWIWQTDEHGRFSYSSPQVHAVLGYSPAEVLGYTSFDFMPADRVQENRNSFRRAVDREPDATHCAFEAVARHRDGRLVDVEVSETPIRDETGRVIGYRGVTRDISERKRAEESLRRKLAVEEMVTRISARFIDVSAEEVDGEITGALEEIASFAGADVCYLNLYSRDGTVLDARYESGAVPRLTYTVEVGDSVADFGWAIAQLREGRIVDMPDMSHLPAEAAPLAQALLSYGVQAALTIPLIHTGRLLGSLGLNAAEPRRWPDEYRTLLTLVAHILGTVLARRQAEREREKLQAQLVQAQKMEAIGQLTAGVAHDFNNLLTVINGYIELLTAQTLPGDPRRDWADRIAEAGWRAADLTRQLLIFSRKQVTQPKILDLNAVVAEVGTMLHRIIGEDIQLKNSPGRRLWPVRADPTQVEQIIINLAANARDAMPSGGLLTIETANVVLDEQYIARHIDVQAGPYVLLAVSDTGVGMSEDVKRHLFEPFFTTKAAGKGTGLGLATVYGIVKQNGGQVWVYSEPGQGSTFKIYLPRAEQGVGRSTAYQPEAPSPRGTETVLLVEDDDGVRSLSCSLLAGLGYRVLEAADGHQAVRIAAEYPNDIHLLMTDVILPGLNGKELSVQLCRLRPGLKVLFVSGYTDDAIVHHGVLEPGVAFLQKPFNLDGLARRVRDALGGQPGMP